ncbi:MAG: glycosyltransferase family 2 protein [Bacteroidales bacterium]
MISFLLHIGAWAALGLAGLRFLVSVTNALGPRRLPPGVPGKSHNLSVLIPARNEESNIGPILDDLLAGDTGGHVGEILVYDDLSTDNTAGVVGEKARNHSVVRLIRGGELPPGWLGKNHACHRLAAEARGSFFLFLDADLRLGPGAMEEALARMEEKRLDLLSMFPVQIMKTTGEKVTVPLMNWILLSLLPLPLVLRSKRSSLAAANGQFMLFDADAYRAMEPHARWRGNPVEDIAIAREMKRRGRRVETLPGTEKVRCRMYAGFREAREGFAKNLFEFFGGSAALTLAFWLFLTLAPFLVLVLDPLWWAVYAVLVSGIRVLTSVAGKQPVWQNILLWLPQHVAFLRIIARAWHRKQTGTLAWKDRIIA